MLLPKQTGMCHNRLHYSCQHFFQWVYLGLADTQKCCVYGAQELRGWCASGLADITKGSVVYHPDCFFTETSPPPRKKNFMDSLGLQTLPQIEKGEWVLDWWICCSSVGPRLDSQLPYGLLQPSATSISWDPYRLYGHYIYMQGKTLMHRIFSREILTDK